MRSYRGSSLFTVPLLAGVFASMMGCLSGGAEMPTVPPDTQPDLAMPDVDMAMPDLAPMIRIMPIDPASDYAILTKGVALVDAGGGAVSPLVLSGPKAFPVLIDEGKRVIGAAGFLGQGKVLVTGHENYLAGTIANGDNNKLVMNAIGWMAKTAKPVVGVDASLPSIKAALTAAGYQVMTVTPAQLGTVEVYISTAYMSYSDTDVTSVQQFVQNGGGLIVGGPAWPFAGDVLSYPGNRLLAGSGITITKKFDITAATDTVLPMAPSMLLNGLVALDKMIDHAKSVATLGAADLDVAASAAERAIEALPLTAKQFYDEGALFLSLVPTPVLSAAMPLDPAKDLVGRVAVRLQHRYSQELPAAQITASPSAADFPGAISEATPRQTFNVTVNGTYAGRDTRYAYSGAAVPVWRGTGAYAAPGEKITVTVPIAAVNQGLQVQIGSHTDLLWAKPSWVRFPGIVRGYPIDAAQITVASAFGGPIYITVPGGKSLGSLPITISGAVSAPYYVHNTTKLADWQTIRNNPAPWAELESDKIILMLPSSYIRTLADPVALLNQWDAVLDAEADLASISRTRVRAERYLIDRDISNGYMHSGYPIMAPYAEAADLVSVTALRAGKWGYWHELGHNHQWLPWVMQGTTESSVNLWSVYVSETVMGIPRAMAHPSITAAMRTQRVQAFITGGRKYATWGNDAWLPLEMYLMLQEGFGWAPYMSIMADYNALPAAMSPATDQERVDQWVLRFSQKVGKNLGPFFTSWGLPVSAAIMTQIAALPAWTANPMP